MNLLEQQVSNRHKTRLVVLLFVGFLLVVGYGFDLFVLGVDRAAVPVGALAALGIGSISAVTSYFAGDRAVLRSTGAMSTEQAGAAAAEEAERFRIRQFENVLDEMTIAAGLPRPKAFIIRDPDPNAFATGRDPEHASVAVTQGLLDLLTRDELQGVVAHEMSHIRNYDIRLMTLVAALVGAVVLLSDWAGRSLRYGSRGGRRSGKRDSRGAGALFLLLWLVAIILAPLIARILAMAVSRQREYLADASGGELTRNPGALAAALEKIEAAAAPTRAIKRGSAHLCIADPLGRRVNLREGFWADLFATHPPMRKRIDALRRMAYERRPTEPGGVVATQSDG